MAERRKTCEERKKGHDHERIKKQAKKTKRLRKISPGAN